MGAKRERVLPVDCHRPVNWNEAAVQRVIDNVGYVYAQTKKDGIRFHAMIDANDRVRVLTREGIEILSLDLHKERLRGLLQALPKQFALDGEAVVPGIPFEEASGILRRHKAIPMEDAVEFWVWDALPVTELLGYEAGTATLDERIDTLVQAFDSTPGPQAQIVHMEPVSSMEELYLLFDAQRELGEEGLVVKDPSLAPRNGKVSGAWKLKPSDTCDGRITGVLWGTPGLGNAGKIIGFTVELENGNLCDVDGLTQAAMAEYTVQVENWAHCQSPPEYVSPHPFVGRYVEVSYMEMTAKGSLRHPKFKTFRDLDYAPGWKS